MTVTINVDGPVEVIQQPPDGGGGNGAGPVLSVAAGVIAAGTAQTDATLLTAQFTEVTGCAPRAGVVISAALLQPGGPVEVHNATMTNPLYVYPGEGVRFNKQAPGAALSVQPNNTRVFRVLNATQIYTVP